MIAQSPAIERDDSRLLVIRRAPHGGKPRFEDLTFRDLPQLVREEDLSKAAWVRNRTRVFPARLYAQRPSGSQHEIVLVREIAPLKWEAIVRNVKRFDFPQHLQLRDNPEITFVSPEPGILDFSSSPLSVLEMCHRYGEMPLPPYIKDRNPARDQQRYQSVWARENEPRSVAAPTASLHFTPQLLSELTGEQVRFIDIELDVGLGTFEPLRHDRIDDNVLHEERFSVSSEPHRELKDQIATGQPLLCVGTTAMRCLESLDLDGRGYRGTESFCDEQQNLRGETRIFIKPGTDVRYTSHLLTNFHLPESSLYMLVATFAGSLTLAREAYAHAVRKNYRFFSYGDATIWL